MGLKEFSGELDTTPELSAAQIKTGGALNTAGEIASDMGKMWGQGSAGVARGIGRIVQAPIATAKELGLGLWSAVSDQEDPRAAPRRLAAQQASAEAHEARARNVAAGNAFSAAGKAIENVGDDANKFYQNVSPEMAAQQKAVADAEGFFGKSKALITNPRALAGTVVRSMPDMAVGMGAGRMFGAAGKFATDMAQLPSVQAFVAAAQRGDEQSAADIIRRYIAE